LRLRELRRVGKTAAVIVHADAEPVSLPNNVEHYLPGMGMFGDVVEQLLESPKQIAGKRRRKRLRSAGFPQLKANSSPGPEFPAKPVQRRAQSQIVQHRRVEIEGQSARLADRFPEQA